MLISNEAGMEALGGQLAKLVHGGEIIFLQGKLGAGKTTLARGFLSSLGHNGKVKSPTYTMVEHYELGDKIIYHFDLYRLHAPGELEDIGCRDYCVSDAICLFEWPENGKGVMPDADLVIAIEHAGSGREVKISPGSEIGAALINNLQMTDT